MSNRVEDLENQVAELQATIDGLTEELVETKERVSELEEQAEEAETLTGGTQDREHPTTAEQQAEARATDERRDAQFVENDPAEAAPEESGEAAEAETEAADDDDDDDEIIVA